jgi:two-component system, NarL family, invasion response regulator UvrY
VPVIVVDDQAPFRAAARAVVARLDGFELVGEASSGEDGVALVEALHPALVLMDVNMPGMDGIEATRQILARTPSTVVFLCSTVSRADLPAEAATSGARAYVPKDVFSGPLLHRLWADRGPDGATAG